MVWLWCRWQAFRAMLIAFELMRTDRQCKIIAKLFAMILDHRIAVWAEDEGIKAKGQAGFRKDFRTTDNIFVLKSLIDKQKQTHGKLYSCFVDFKKAFDTVPRGLLWQVLETVGIRGPILDCIKSLYSHDSAAVKNQEGISDIFDCLMGVKQGCPLGATLWAICGWLGATPDGHYRT